MNAEKVVLVTRKTRLAELVERFNTKAQARFYLESAGLNFEDYEDEDDTYRRARDFLHRQLDVGLPVQALERALVSTYLFSATDVVVAVGQDGLVANVAKYVGAQPLLGVNPDPKRFDGVLLPFSPGEARGALSRTCEGRGRVRQVTLARAALGDGQTLLGFNDLFIGARSHVSARYLVRLGDEREAQSSSGVLVSTGAGSTGWLSSVFNMAAGLARFSGAELRAAPTMSWEDPRLFFAVREPFKSRHSGASLNCGFLSPSQALELESRMPQGGVVFSDGIESDFLEFNSGALLKVTAAEQRAQLVVG